MIREVGDVTGEDLLALAAAMSGIPENSGGEVTSHADHQLEAEAATAPVVEKDHPIQQDRPCDNRENGESTISDVPQQEGAPTFIPLWDMRPMDRRRRPSSVYEGLELDPRLFFLGAPSTYSTGQEAEALRGIHERARRLGDRSLRFLPPDFTSYHREESAVLPDGTIYRIGSTLTRRYPPLRTTGCQTEERTVSGPCKRDAATQTTKEEGTNTETQCEIIQARIY